VNMGQLRRLSIWMFGVLAIGLTLYGTGNNLARSWRHQQLITDVRLAQADLTARSEQLSAQIAALEPERFSQPIQAGDATLAAAALDAQIQDSFVQGQLVNHSVQADDSGLMSSQLLWRGDEAQMRAGLEAVSQALPGLSLTRLDIRAVSNNGIQELELSAHTVQPWVPAG
jgi:hypothetical protein